MLLGHELGKVTMIASQLDAVDNEIIAILSRDARTPVTVLSEILSLSRNTVQKRVDRLINSGVIEAFTIRLNQSLKPQKILAMMAIEIEGASTQQIITLLKRIDGAERFHTTNGNWDMLIDIEAEDLAQFDDILKQVRSIKGVLNSETSIILSTTHR